ncbi:hypothetical protein [Chryseobacterium sp. VD8]|uniref:hypothetical protein n=1 Tax=Chryseobacterium sp. VD8 TaxID=3081254 RepID=UPI003016AE00
MTKLEKFKLSYETFIGSFISVALLYLSNFLMEFVTKNPRIQACITILMLTTLVAWLNRVVVTAVERLSCLRKWIDRTNFIEGFWYDITYDDDRNIVHVVFLTITFENSKYELCGEAFDKVGNKISTFNSSHSHFINHELTAFVNSTGDKNILERSFDYYNFNKTADSYNGFYIDFSTLKPKSILGKRVNKEDVKKFNGFKKFENIEAFIKTII